MTLYLLPNLLGKQKEDVQPDVAMAVAELDGLIAESPQGGRSFLNRYRTKKPPYDIPLAVYNEHSKKSDIDFFLRPVKTGETWGLISDAGLPCIADPGSALVYRARQMGIKIKALAGPSAIFLTLMLAGLPAQKFTFHGYPSSKKEERRKQFLQWEKEGGTHLFIEAPYRNDHVLQDLVTALNDNTLLTVACDLGQPSEFVMTNPISSWKKSTLPDISKKPVVFAFNL